MYYQCFCISASLAGISFSVGLNQFSEQTNTQPVRERRGWGQVRQGRKERGWMDGWEGERKWRIKRCKWRGGEGKDVRSKEEKKDREESCHIICPEGPSMDVQILAHQIPARVSDTAQGMWVPTKPNT